MVQGSHPTSQEVVTTVKSLGYTRCGSDFQWLPPVAAYQVPLPKNQSATCRVAGTTPDGEWLKFVAPINLKTYKFGHVFVSRHSL